jgi:hypothetical protein
MNFGYGIVLIKIWLQKHICKKSGSALISPDKHKTLQERRRFLPSFLEWLDAGARQFSKSKQVILIL